MDFPGVDLISAIIARNPLRPGLRVVNDPWDGTGVYLVDNDGTLRHIPDPATYTNLFGSTNVVSRHLSGIPHGPDLSSDAHLVWNGVAGDPIYLVSNGQKRHIASPAVMDKFWFNSGKVLTAPSGALDATPDGPDLT